MMLAAMETLTWDPDSDITKPVFACELQKEVTSCKKKSPKITGQVSKQRSNHFDFWHSLFADDCGLLFASRKNLIDGTEQIYKHLAKFGLQMHVGRGNTRSKTEAMCIPSKAHPDGDTSKYMVDGDGFVEFTDEFKYLGTMMNSTLSMSKVI